MKSLRNVTTGWVIASVCMAMAGRAITQAAGPAEQANHAQPPNFLFIVLDDCNDWVGPLHGHPMVKTPNIDRLAARGVTFLNAHAQAPLCNSSRTSVMLGVRPGTTGIYGLAPWFRTLPKWKDAVTLPQYLQHHGYETLTTGKVYHGAYPPPAGRRNGAEFSVWGPHGQWGPFPKHKFVDTPSKIKAMDWGVYPQREQDYSDYQDTSWAIEQLKHPPKQPFMLCLGIRHPHVPLFAPQKYFDLYPNNDSVLPPVKLDDRDDVPFFAWYLHWKEPEPRLTWLRKAHQWVPIVRSYLASISLADAQIGRALDALDASGMADNTIVILWSDQGWHLGSKDMTGKNSLWDRSTHVPMIFAGPGIARGVTCDAPVELLDLYPTMAQLAGLPPKSGLDGRSLVPLLRDVKAEWQWPAITTCNQGNDAIRTRRWRYIRYHDGSQELYDMKADPNEWTNLAGQAKYAGVINDLRQWLPKDATLAPGSAARVLEYKPDGTILWEGKPIVNSEVVK